MPKNRKVVELLPEAREDLQEVARYSQMRWGPDGRRYLRGMREAIRGMWDYRQLWMAVPEHEAYQRLRYEKHNIYFTCSAQTVTVRAILHTSMDPERHL